MGMVGGVPGREDIVKSATERLRRGMPEGAAKDRKTSGCGETNRMGTLSPERETENGSFSDFARDFDLGAVSFDNVFGDGKAQTSAAQST